MSNSVTKKVSDDVHRDMLSDLPDSVILHILSFLMTKHAIRTCILSSRWKHLWKCLPSLILRRSDFACKEIFMEFMYKVLSLRDSSVSLHTLDFEGTLFISSATLVNFTMHAESDEDNQYKIDLCTPSLCTFAFRGIPYQEISWSNISSLKHVDIDAQLFPYTCSGPPLFLFNWLSEFGNIKSLTVTTNTLQSLTLVPDLLEFKIPFMGKLKFLKVKIEEIEYDLHMMLCDDKLQNVKSEEEAARIQKAFDSGLEPSPLVPDGIVDFLLQNSPSAEVDLVDCRENPFRQRL
ncbi:putative F-box/LRR-repeat protein At5g02930 isoform X3 [Vicia villosa]|uniref:putative F-box/LRR-repeat protein At5g02930 isoform X3 n=1 Tax=Vicia villosa TaxID=3911 RepID=UPI00273ABBC6|nr:putative F-box/LRR-repeat protein At5g02930 isoform X3 [Vicia villosa]